MKLQVMEFLQSADLKGMTRDKCAEAMGIHPHTLQRKLQEEDVCFLFLLGVERNDRIRRASSPQEAAQAAGLSIDRIYRNNSRAVV